MTEYPSCVPKRTVFKSFTLREDFFAIVNDDIINAAVLSVAEMKTNESIEKLRSVGSIAGDGPPPEECLCFCGYAEVVVFGGIHERLYTET